PWYLPRPCTGRRGSPHVRHVANRISRVPLLRERPGPSPADGRLQGVDGGLDARIGGHREVFHLEADPVVVTDHAHDREELLPPLQIVTGADRDVVPRAVSDVGDLPQLQETVDIRLAAFDARVLAVAMMDRLAESTGR